MPILAIISPKIHQLIIINYNQPVTIMNHQPLLLPLLTNYYTTIITTIITIQANYQYS